MIKPLRVLWNQVLGFLMAVMAIWIGGSAVRIIIRGPADAGDVLRIVMAGFCSLLLGGYGISSFLRARKISRS